MEGQAEAKADQDSLTQAEEITHLCRNLRAQIAERTRALCALANCLSAAWFAGPNIKYSAQEKHPIGENLRVSVRFVYHQIVLGTRSPNHQFILKFAEPFDRILSYRFGSSIFGTTG